MNVFICGTLFEAIFSACTEFSGGILLQFKIMETEFQSFSDSKLKYIRTYSSNESQL